MNVFAIALLFGVAVGAQSPPSYQPAFKGHRQDGATLAITLTDEALHLTTPSRKTTIVIPYTAISHVTYSHARGGYSPLIGVWGMLSTEHWLNIVYTVEGQGRYYLLRLNGGSAKQFLGNFEAKSGLRVERAPA